MTDRYLVQYRLVKLPNRDVAPDRWSSATSTMTVAEASTPIDAGSDSEAMGRAVDVLPDQARKLWLGARSPQETSDELVAQAPVIGPDDAPTGYRDLEEPLIGQAVVMDDVFVAAAVSEDGRPAISVIFVKDDTSMPGMVLVGGNAAKVPDLVRKALAGATDFIKSGGAQTVLGRLRERQDEQGLPRRPERGA